MSTRLNSAKRGSRVIVMQRLHQQDLAGHVLDQGGWEHLNLPAEFEPSRRTFTCIGWSDPRKLEGELLWPERIGQPEIAKAKRNLGPIGYAGQYQQRPAPAGGATFKQEWIRRYRINEKFIFLESPDGEKSYALANCRRIATVDIASKKTEQADYTVIGTWLITPNNELVLREIIRARMNNPEQQAAIKDIYARWRHESIHIEAVAYQLALVQQLLPLGIPVMPFNPVADKVSRASTAAIFYAASMVFHPHWAQWLEDFEQELLLFPKAEHDDQVDVVSMACALLFEGGEIPAGVTGGSTSSATVLPNRYTSPDEEENQQLQQRQDSVAEILNVLRKLGGIN